MASSWPSVTTFTQKAPRSRMLRSESLATPPRVPMDRLTSMGEDATAEKKLKGATLRTPSALRVETQPMGRGTTREVRSW